MAMVGVRGWRSSLTPVALSRRVLGKQVGQPSFAKPPSDGVLEALRDGYREASRSGLGTLSTDAQPAALERDSS